MNEKIIRNLAEERGTPLFIYDANSIDRKCSLLKSLKALGVEILYSIKANPNAEVCQFIRNQELLAEIASRGELAIARESGFDLSSCMVAGPAKKIKDIVAMIEGGIGFINCESVNEAKRINDIARAGGRRIKINIRINPRDIGAGSRIKMGGRSSPFGIDEEEMDEALEQLDQLDMIELSGIHVYSGTQFLDPLVIRRNFEYVFQLSQHFRVILGRAPSVINFGGGFGIPFSGEEQPIDEALLMEELYSFFSKIRADESFWETRFFIESGRFITGDCGYFVCSIVDIKVSRGKKFVIVDGGINNYMSLSPHFRFDGKNPGVYLVRHSMARSLVAGGDAGNEGGDAEGYDPESVEVVDIAGPLCTSLDCLARKVSLSSPQIGDLVVFPNAGAYSLSMSPTGFLSHDLPGEVLIW